MYGSLSQAVDVTSPTATASAVDATSAGPLGDYIPGATVQHVMRRFSANSERAGRKQRLGTPQLHHILQASAANENDEDEDEEEEKDQSGSNLDGSVARSRHRRYQSADFALHALKKARSEMNGLGDEWEGPSQQHHEDGRRERRRLSSLSSLRRPSVPLLATKRSGNLNKSSSTIQESSHEDQETEDEQEPRGRSLRRSQQDERINVFGYLDTAGDPPRTKGDGLERTVEQDAAASWSTATNLPDIKPSSPSPTAQSTSSGSSNSSASVRSAHSAASSEKTTNTEVSFPELGAGPGGDDDTPVAAVPARTIFTENQFGLSNKRRARRHTNPDRYGTPEMPRGTARLPHIPSSHGLTPRMPNQGHVKHLPRAEKLPMSGYELLASSISAAPSSSLATGPRGSRTSAYMGSSPSIHHTTPRRNSTASFATTVPWTATGPEDVEAVKAAGLVKPIYRKFEALNHRLLLHLQDELSELEEQLHRLDTTDTQTRRLQSRILPASRRAEFLAGGELQWHKTDILGKIGFKLGQYNHVLSSFTATRDLPAPSLSDVDDYRNYLATHQPITEVETRFLDPIDDLITLAAPDKFSSSSVGGISRENNTADGAVPAPPHYHLDEPYNDDHHRTVTPIPGTMHGNSWLAARRQSRRYVASAGGSGSRSGSQSSGSRSSSPHLPAGEQSRHSNTLPQIAEPQVTMEKPATTPRAPPQDAAVIHVAVATAVAVLVPILTFSVIPGFVGRMAVVLLVGLSVLGSLAQSWPSVSSSREAKNGGGVRIGCGKDLVSSATLYAAVMAAVAGVVV